MFFSHRFLQIPLNSFRILPSERDKSKQSSSVPHLSILRLHSSTTFYSPPCIAGVFGRRLGWPAKQSILATGIGNPKLGDLPWARQKSVHPTLPLPPLDCIAQRLWGNWKLDWQPRIQLGSWLPHCSVQFRSPSSSVHLRYFSPSWTRGWVYFALSALSEPQPQPPSLLSHLRPCLGWG